MKKLWSLIALFVILFPLIVACGDDEEKATAIPAPTKEEVTVVDEYECTDEFGCVEVSKGENLRIASVLVLSGANQTLGLDSQRGVEIAIDWRGDVMGFPVELVAEDGGCSAEGGQTAAAKVVSDETIVAVVGHNCSSSCQPGAPIYDQAGFTMISPSCTSPALTGYLGGDHVSSLLRTCHQDLVQGAASARFFYDSMGIRTAATVHDGSPYAEELQRVFADTFRELGGTITAQEAVNVGDTDMKPMLTSIGVDEPELLYYPIFIAEGGFITMQAKEVDGLAGTILAGADGMMSPDFVEAAGDAGEGMYHTGPNLSFKGDTYQRFLDTHQEKYGEDPLSVFHAHAFDAANVILDAVEKVGVLDADGNLHIGRKELREAIYATSNHQGITGNLSCDENGDCADPSIAVSQLLGGEYVPVWNDRDGLLSDVGGDVVAEYECTDEFGCVQVAAGENLRVASVLVLSGANQTLGLDSQRGVEIAIDWRGDVMGFPVELVAEDGACSAEGGQTAAAKVVSDETIVAVVGHNCSSSCQPAAPIYDQAGFTMISPSCTSPALTGYLGGTHVDSLLRTCHQDLVQGSAAARFFYDSLGIRTAATIHDGSPYAEELQRVFADTFRELGGTITAQEAVNVGDTDMKPMLTSIGVDEPELLYYPIFIAEGGFITMQAKEVDGLAGTILAGADGMMSPDFVEAAGDAGEGMYHTGPNLSFKGDTYQQFLATHQEKYGEDPLSVFHAHAFDAANVIFDAIEVVGVIDADGNLNIGRKELREAIYATSNHQGITGNLNCDENGDCADPSIAVSQLLGGEYVAVWNDKEGLLGGAGEPADCTSEISIWHGWTGAYLEAIEAAFAEFSNTSGICVELSQVSDLSDALAVAVPAGEGPDILAWVQDQIGRNAITGNVVPIDEFVDMSFLDGNYEPAAVEAMVWNGQIWGLPESQEGIAIIYNADLVGPDDFPSDPLDFDGLLAKATAFREANPDMYLVCNQGLGAGSSDAYHVAPVYFGIGGADDIGYVDDEGTVYLNTEARVRAGEWIVNWSAVAPEETSHEICQSMLVDGQAAAWWTGPWATADLEAAGVNIGLLPMGRPFAGIKVLMLTANGYDRGNGDAAIEVMKYFTGAEVQKTLALINKTIPANSAALNDPELQAIAIIAGYGNALNLAVPMPNHPFIDAQWGPAGDATAAIFSGAQSPQEALDDAQAVAEGTVSEIKGE